jgi:MYXO-CTERM domain-containing protein
VFFAWIDSNGQNLGERLRDNEAPDLNVSALRVRDEARTAPRNLTDLDLLWNGVIHFPRMAPEVLLRDRQWHLPIVTVELLSNDPTQPVQFHYFGERATFHLDVFGGVIDPPDPDAGVVDAEVVDAQVVDAQVVDAQVIDGDLADAEVVTDAAPADAAPADAAPADGGPEADGGVAVDGGVADGAAADGATADRGAADAAPGIDQAGVGALDAALNDGAVDGALGSDGGGDGGCGCRVEAHNPPTSFGILALSLLGLVRRRRR